MIEGGAHVEHNKMEQSHNVLIDFDPLRITLPGAGPFAGTVHIILPEFHLKFHDLSMGGILGGAHIGADGRCWSLDIPDIPEPGMTAGQLTAFVEAAQDELKKMHRLIQAEMDKKFLLDR